MIMFSLQAIQTWDTRIQIEENAITIRTMTQLSYMHAIVSCDKQYVDTPVVVWTREPN